MTQAVIDYSIHVVKEDANYRVFCECTLSGELAQSHLLAAEVAHFAEVGVHLRAETVDNTTLIVEGQRLFKAIFKGDLESHFSRSRNVAQAQEQSLRIVVKFEHFDELHEIPWEILHDGDTFIAILPQSPVVRYVRQSRPIVVGDPPTKLRILFTTASPVDLAQLDLQTEEQYLRENLRSLGDRVNLEVMKNVSFRNLHFRLTSAQAMGQPFHIWHHAGHGMVDKDGRFKMVLVANEEAELHSIDGFSMIIQACPALKMALLNVCYAGSTHGLGAEFASLNLPYVYGYRSQVLDHFALEFAYQFYALLPHTTIEAAIGVARSAIYSYQSNSGHPTWSQPVLYARTQAATRLLLDAIPAPETIAPPQSSTQELQTKINQKIGIIQSSSNIAIIGQLNKGAAPASHTNTDIDQTLERLEDSNDMRIIGQKNSE